MKASEIREMQSAEILGKVSELEEELFNLRFQDKVGQLANPLLKRTVGREIARLKTVLREKESIKG